MNGRRLVFALVAASLVAALGVPLTSAQSEQNTFVRGIVGQPPTVPVNPLVRSSNPRAQLWMFEGLVSYTTDLRPRGQLAERWDVSEDGLTYTFHLRRNVKWHDGRAFTANDVVFTAEAALNVRNNSPMRRYYLVRGQPVRVEKVDTNTVRFHLSSASALFIFNMSQWNMIVPRHLLEGKELATADFNARPVGTGPFKFVELQDRQFIRMAANPDYYMGKPKLDFWVDRALGDQNAALAAFAKGEVDFIGVNSRDAIETARRIPNTRIYSYNAGWIYALNMNLKTSHFSDVRVRRALAYAFDREQLARAIAGDVPVAWSVIGPPSSWAHNPNIPKYSKDVARAKELLSEAGFRPGPDGIVQKDGRPFKFTVLIQSGATDSDPESYAVALRQEFRAIGVNMEIQRLDRPTLEKRLFEDKQFEAYLWWNGYSFEPDPAFYWHSASAINNYAHPELDLLIDQAASVTNRDARKRFLDAIAMKIARDAAFIPLYHFSGFMATKTSIKFPASSAADFNNSAVLYEVHTIEKGR
ncbi:MAG: ABC transporter substrate-binding protein [Armatimonadota bacterium]